jgi:hypothetical protein
MMQTRFYVNSKIHLWDKMKGIICQNILDNHCGYSGPKYYIHFDKMLFRIGWFVGFVEIWKGTKPYEKNKWRIQFVVHVINWGCRIDCQKRPNYRVTNKG